VIAPHRRSRVTVTFTGVTVEDADAVGGRLVLRLNVGDQAARWPEEGAADVEDGKGYRRPHLPQPPQPPEPPPDRPRRRTIEFAIEVTPLDA
jgi:hypothetical protein